MTGGLLGSQGVRFQRGVGAKETWSMGDETMLAGSLRIAFQA